MWLKEWIEIISEILCRALSRQVLSVGVLGREEEAPLGTSGAVVMLGMANCLVDFVLRRAIIVFLLT
jgi:hypothetical protein